MLSRHDDFAFFRFTLDKRRKDKEIEKRRQDFIVAENRKKIEEEERTRRINDVKTLVEKLAWDENNIVQESFILEHQMPCYEKYWADAIELSEFADKRNCLEALLIICTH